MTNQSLEDQPSAEPTVDGKALYLTTAGGQIKCMRCTACSTRTLQQCGRPALKSSKTQKCQFHGGRSSGPKTPEGKARIAASHTVHGEDSKSARTDRSAASAKLNRLEDAMHLLGMTTAPRTTGRKPRGYEPLKTLDDVRQMVLDSF
jgi:hypothetical protein